MNPTALSNYYQGMNPLGDSALIGYNFPVCGNYKPQFFIYAGTFTVAAGVAVYNQLISIDTDADFVAQGLVVNTTGMDLQFLDSENYTFSNDFIPSTAFSTNFGAPFPFFPEVFLPAGGKFGLNLRNATVGNITITVSLVGYKLFRL